jgi:hypothetical protein
MMLSFLLIAATMLYEEMKHAPVQLIKQQGQDHGINNEEPRYERHSNTGSLWQAGEREAALSEAPEIQHLEDLLWSLGRD